MTARRKREYLTFPRETDKAPRLRHGRTDDVTQTEAIRRPAYALPRVMTAARGRVEGWQA
jgi:hypothetical protein